jgi:hypothetical protein
MRFAPGLTTGRATGAAAVPQLASSIPCNSTWNTVASANASSGRNVLAGLAAIAPNDVWAVGFYVNGSSVYQTLAEHWDGSAWSIVTTPNVGPGNNLLTAVTAIGPGDVWAVGFWRPGNSTTVAQPLTEHWNGNGWTVVSAPTVPNYAVPLYGVGSDASGDVWAVGVSYVFPVQATGPRGQAFAIQWTGGGWSIVPTASVVAPFAGPGVDFMGLSGVKVLSPTDAWAVGDGQDYTGSTPVSPDMAFIEHWNGSSWSQVQPPTHPNGDFLVDVQGTATDLWVVGGQNQAYQSAADNVLIEHWNGATWTEAIVPPPSPAAQSANLFGLGYIASNNVYAVGASASNPGTSLELDQTLIERWNGATWSQVTSANPGMNDGLSAIAAISANDVWAAGFNVVNNYSQTLTENVCTPPAVTSVTPSSGNPGSTVVITGSGFSRAIDVEFGATPAFTFHVDSDTQITAVSPGHKAGMVDITVTVQGTSATSSGDQFTYQGSISGAAPGSGTFQNRTSPPPPVPAAPPHPRGIARGAPIPI